MSPSPFVCCRCAQSLVGAAIVWSVRDRRYAHTACLARARRAARERAAARARNMTVRAVAAEAAIDSPETAAIRAAMRRAR